MTLAPGLRSSMLIMVEREDTAQKLGSGDVPVLATPRLVLLAEMCTMQALRPHLEPGQTTVGTRVEVDHLAASLLGAHVEISTELVQVEGRRLVFAFVARERDLVVGRGTVDRALVDREKFLSRAAAR
ncbi:MAG: thioesterase family protein [Thermoactinospora sp.]|nr:thioesterase family protein [Thermoactinospora sp.]